MTVPGNILHEATRTDRVTGAGKSRTPDRTRTGDRGFGKTVLYPTELQR